MEKGYTVDQLIERLEEVRTKHSNTSIKVLMCTETKKTGQVEQPVADVAFTSREGRGGPVLILLPEGF